MDKKSILNEIKTIIFGAEKELIFKEAKSGDFILRVEGEDFVEGADIFLVTSDGLIPVEDGTYPLEDGRELYVAAGKIEKIEVAEETPEAEIAEGEVVEMAEVDLLDGKKITIEGDVAVGNAVSIDGEKAAEGQYDLADGRVIYVDAEGLINEIQTPDTKAVDEELEVEVEAPEYVSEMPGMTASVVEEKMGEMEKRIEELEKTLEEMGKINMEVAKFSKIVQDKLESFVKETPATLEFNSLKSDFNSYIERNKDTKVNNLEAIRNLRAKK